MLYEAIKGGETHAGVFAALFFMAWYIIRCPGKRRNGDLPCAYPLRLTSTVEVNKEELICCNACGAQSHLKFNALGALEVSWSKERIRVEAEDYPFVAERRTNGK